MVTATSQRRLDRAQTFTININDVDEFDPVFAAADYPATVAEDLATRRVIATVAATDADATATVSYSITGGNGAGLFEIDASHRRGHRPGKSLDAETATSHVLTITASDGDGR